jgi:diguanylate cyclase (GGDEF)-like protein
MGSVPAALRPLQQQFLASRNERIAELKRLSALSLTDARALDPLRVAFHKLAGSAGLLGFPASGLIARKAEHLLDHATAPPAELDGVIAELIKMVEEEASVVDQPSVGQEPAAEHRTTTSVLGKPASLASPSENRHGVACIVANQVTPTVDALCSELAAASFDPRVVLPEHATRDCAGAAVACVDVTAAGDGYALCRQIANIHNAPCLRILYTDGNASFDLLKMSPARAHRIIHRPFELRSVLRPDPNGNEFIKARILSVEDDPDYAIAIDAFLTPVGHQVKVISRPEQVLEEIAEFRPELLLLDWDLPHLSGHDLARIIRSDARHELLPIVFCTGRGERRDRRAAVKAGADDFITKPFAQDELIETIDTLLRRHRALRRRLDADGLTELLNRSASLAALDESIQRARTAGTSVLVSILDLDHFKQVNDELGHPTGDRVLREMAAHLKSSQRPGEIAGRLGGEEMLFSMVGSDRDEMLRHLDDIRESLLIELRANDGAFLRKVTFSAGVAWFPQHGNHAGELLKRADTALYEAKFLGRNRIVVAK